MLIFLVIIFLGINIASGVLVAITLKRLTAGEFYLLTCRAQLIGKTPEDAILFGFLECIYSYEGNIHPLIAIVWILNTVWEVLALCLSVWIAVRQFRDLQRLSLSTGSTFGDCFRVLIKSHVLYFAR
jgi:hypothetical protein